MEQEVVVTFEPDEEGYFTGTLSIENNDPENPVFEVNLEGEGLMQQAIISVPKEIHFDTTTVNNSSTKTFEVWNIGNADLEVTDVICSSTEFAVDVTSFTINPGQFEEVLVTFSPITQGDHNAILEIISNDVSSPTEIMMSGYASLETGIFSNITKQSVFSAYPNPFESKVEISYYSNSPENQKIIIVNLLGKMVKEIIPRDETSDKSTYSWNGTNQSGEEVPKGVYFGIIEMNNTRHTIKIIKR
jgi:hypothetical protein